MSDHRFVRDVPGTCQSGMGRVRPVRRARSSAVDANESARAAQLKRVFDVSGATLALVVLCPFLLVVAALAAAATGATPLYRQRRVGRHGRPFLICKFRTMSPRSDGAPAPVPARPSMAGLKDQHDPRVTALGRLLRRYSVDELPQLLNVVRGDMSLIGPRPFSPEFLERSRPAIPDFEEWIATRHQVRPGMTGLWQVNGRSDLPASELMRLDLEYVRLWRIAVDVQILARTPGAVLSKRGAY
jgi:lipopolysaccharide/colanic/teichoic acid biosynthesis glycosyltransferase